MTNKYYNAPTSKVPLTTIRSANRNSQDESLEDAFDLLPDPEDLNQNQVGTDASTVNSLYEITVSFLPSPLTVGYRVRFLATYTCATNPQISVNSTTNYNLVDNAGNQLVAGAISAGQIVEAVWNGTEYQVTNPTTVLTGTSFTPIADNTYDIGTSSFRYKDLHLAGTANVGTMDITGGSITDTSGAISFGNENLSTTGTLAAGATTITGALTSNADNGGALGASGTGWSDLFLATGAVINFNAGDVILTHSFNALAISGGVVTISDASDHQIGGNWTKTTDTDGIVVSGGNTASSGGNFLARGGTHATLANDWALRSGSTDIVYWDDSAGTLTLDSGTIPTTNLTLSGASGSELTEAAGSVDIVDRMRVKEGAPTVPSSGTGLELYYASSVFTGSPAGYLISYDRDLSTYKPLVFDASAFTFSTGNSTFAGAVIVPNIYNAAANSDIIFSGGSSASLGANMRVFGESHATRANDIDFRASTTSVLNWDESDNEWTVPNGDLTLSEGKVSITNTDNETAFSITSSATTNNVASITANSAQTGNTLQVYSNSSDTNTRNIVRLVNDNTLATGATVLTLQQDAAQRALFIDHNGNGYGFELQTTATTSQGIRVLADSLTTGAGLLVSSNSSGFTNADGLVFIKVDHASASGHGLKIQNDGIGIGLDIDQNGNRTAFNIDSESTTVDTVYINAASTSGNGVYVEANALTTGSAIEVLSNDTDTSTRYLINLRNSNAAATGARVLRLEQNASQNALFIDVNGNGEALFIDSEATTAHVIRAQAPTNDYVASFINEHASAPNGLQIDFSAASPDNNTQAFLFCQDSVSTRCLIYSDGDIQNHDNSYGALSDERLKSNVVGIFEQGGRGSYWDDFRKVRHVKYQMNTDIEQYGDSAPWQIGVVAQELQKVFPGLIKVGSDDEQMLGVKYSILHGSIMGCVVQEAMGRIEALEAANDPAGFQDLHDRMATWESKVETVDERLARLEAENETLKQEISKLKAA